MKAGAFLEVVAGYTRTATDGSADKPVRIAVVDPAWTTGLPRVTFEGESTMSLKAYPYLESYKPFPGDRVLMLPVGNTYAIIGSLDDGLLNLVDRVKALEDVPAWTGVTFDSDWTNYGTGQETVAYRKERDRVFLKGLLKPVTAGGAAIPLNSSNPFFTLPVGFRPALEHIFTAMTNSGIIEVRVIPSGVCHPGTPVRAGTFTYVATTWVTLAGFSFPAA